LIKSDPQILYFQCGC